MKDPSINVNMDGEDYYKHLHLMDLRKRRTNKKIFSAMPFFIVSVILMVLCFLLIQDVTYVKPQPVDYGSTAIHGYVIPNIMIYFIVVSICLAWVFHGFGFLVIRR